MQTAAFPITMHEGEPRVLDVHLAAQLGFARPTEIRRIIARHRQNLSKISVLATVTQTPGSVGGRPSISFYLSKKQAIFITAKSETPKAIEVTLAIIERFDAYERAAASPLPTTDPTHALSVVREARETFGMAAARRAWIALGLPAGPEMLAIAEAAPRPALLPAQASLFPLRPSLGNPSPEVMARIEARVAKGETRAAAFRAEGASYGAWRVANHRRRIRACGTSLT